MKNLVYCALAAKKNKIFTLLFAIVASIGTMDAEKIGDLYYDLDIWEDANGACVTGTVSEDITSVIIPATIVFENKTYHVVKISDWAFRNCTNLTSVTLPSSITYIEDFAFLSSNVKEIRYNGTIAEWCNKKWKRSNVAYQHSLYIQDKLIDNLIIPNGISDVTDFGYCTSLKSVVMGDDVESIGGSAFYKCENLKSVTMGKNIAKIGSWAFYGCDSLLSIEIYDKIDTIEESAFWKCASLNSVKIIGNGSTTIGTEAFLGCKNLETLVIGNGVKTIGWSAFSSCTKLTSVVIPDNVTKVSREAFRGSSSLKSVSIGCEVIEAATFYNCKELESLLLGEKVTTIKENAFQNCSTLTALNIPNSVTTIGADAFKNCVNIQSVSIGCGLTEIGTNAFYYCSKIDTVRIADVAAWCRVECKGSFSSPLNWSSTKKHLYLNDKEIIDLVIPDGVTEIKKWAFARCGYLESITIPQSVTSIAGDVFSSCSISALHIEDIGAWCTINFAGNSSNPLYSAKDDTHLYLNDEEITDLIIPDNVTEIQDYAFAHCKYLKSVALPSGVTSIGEAAFKGCGGVNSFAIPNSVTTIGASAFYGCYGIDSINIPGGVKTIEASTFYRCSHLTSIVIPDSVTKIGSSAFSGCVNLATIYNYAATPQTITTNVFNSVNKSTCKLYVPAESVDAYKAADVWKDFTNISAITEEETTYFTVTFKDWDGTILKIDKVEPNSAATAPTNPTREGYTFIGWDKDFSNVTADMIVTAQYQKDTEPEPERPYVALIGEMNGWDGGINQLIPADDGMTATAKVELAMNDHSGYSFKILVGSIGLSAHGNAGSYVISRDRTSAKLDWVETNSDALWLSMDVAGEYYFTFNFVDSTLTVGFPEKGEPEDPQEQGDIITREVLDLSVDGNSIDDWTITDATINESGSDAPKGKYCYDVKAGIPGISYVTAKSRFQFEYSNSSDKTKAFYVYTGRCYEFGGKNGIINILDTHEGDTIKIEVAAKGSTMGDFEDIKAKYPINATALTEDLTLPVKGSEGADDNGYVWRTLEFLSQGGDVALKEFGGGFRVRLVGSIHIEPNPLTDIDNVNSSSLQGGGDRGRLILRNGQILILRGDKVYTVTGQEVK